MQIRFHDPALVRIRFFQFYSRNILSSCGHVLWPIILTRDLTQKGSRLQMKAVYDHLLRGSGSGLLMATGFVNDKPDFRTGARMCLLEFRWYCWLLRGQISPKITHCVTVSHFRARKGFFSSKKRKIFKLSYYWNYCIVHNQIFTVLKTTKYSSWTFQIRPKQIQDGGRPPIWKIEKSQYLKNRLIDVDKIGAVMHLGLPGPFSQ